MNWWVRRIDFMVFIPHHTKSGGVLCYTVRKFWVSIHPSVSASYPDSNLSNFWPIFFKLCMDMEEWFGIANGLNSWITTELWPLIDVKMSFPETNLSSIWLIFFKLCVDIDNREEWFGIANWLNLLINNRVMALDWCKKCFFLNIFRTNGWILIKFCICID